MLCLYTLGKQQSYLFVPREQLDFDKWNGAGLMYCRFDISLFARGVSFFFFWYILCVIDFFFTFYYLMSYERYELLNINFGTS